MEFRDDKFCTEAQAYAIHQSVKNSLFGKFCIDKYGIQPAKFIKQYDGLGDNVKVAFKSVVKSKQTEKRLVTYFAANLVRGVGWLYDYKDDHYIGLKKFNSSPRFIQDELQELCGTIGTKELFSDKVLSHLTNGKISRELFSTLLIGTDLDEILLKSSQSYIWKIIRGGNVNYGKYITHCTNQTTLVSTLQNCFN